MKTYHLTCNHCERRVLEERRLREYFHANRYAPVESVSLADVALFLSCGMLEEQSAAVVNGLVAQAAAGKRVVVFGCFPSMSKRLNPEVVHVPLSDSRRLDEAVGADVPYASIAYPLAVQSTRRFGSARGYWDPRLVLPHASDVYSLLVSTGCSETCTYCTIRHATGPLRSRPVVEVVADLERGLALGYHTFRLQCENLGVYGKDRGLRLADLLSGIASVRGDFVVDLPDLHPSGFLDSYDEVQALARLGRVLLVHLPVQSANPRILRLMNRNYNICEVSRRLETLRREFPTIPVGTDVIAGFPTEKAEEYNDSYTFMALHAFDWIYLHGYSPKEGAAAERLGAPVAWDTLSERIARAHGSIPNVLCYINNYDLGDQRAAGPLVDADRSVRGVAGLRSRSESRARPKD